MKEKESEKQLILEKEGDTDSQYHRHKDKVSQLFTFLGLMVFTMLYLTMTAAQDILKGTLVPTTTVLLCISLPFFAATFFAPYFIPLVAVTIRIPLVTVFCTSGILLVALAQDYQLKLVGVCFISLGCAIAETSFLSLTAFYDKSAIKMYSGGTGIGYFFGPLYYTAFTAWLCISARTTLFSTAGIPVLILLLFLFINYNKPPVSPEPVSPTTKRKNSRAEANYNWKDKLQTAKRSVVLVVSLITGVSSEYLVIQAVVTTIAFPNALFSPSVHYKLYFFCFATGELLGRSYGFLASYLCPSRTNIYTEKTWIFTGIMFFNLIFTTCTSWFRFVPSVWVLFVILFEHGVTAGAQYLNTFAMAGTHEKHARAREFSRAFVSIGSGLGLTIAGFVGLVIEPLLKEHCLETSTLLNQQYCFTRAVDTNGTLPYCY